MTWARWERFAPLAGIVAVVLWVVGVIVEESTDYPDKDTPQEILAVFQGDPNTLIAAGIIFAFGAVFFIWFLGSCALRSTRPRTASVACRRSPMGAGCWRPSACSSKLPPPCKARSTRTI